MKIEKLNTFFDNRGDLIPIEFDKLPFIPKRLFCVKNVPVGSRRGNHGHYTTKQLLICLKGRILVGIHNGKRLKEKVIKEGESLLINERLWDYQDFLTGKDVLLVICSTKYNKNDYIFDFNRFLEVVT